MHQTIQCLFLIILFLTYCQILGYYLLVKLQDGPEEEDIEGQICRFLNKVKIAIYFKL